MDEENVLGLRGDYVTQEDVGYLVDKLKGMSQRQLKDSVDRVMSYAAMNDICIDMDNIEIALYNIPLAKDDHEMDTPLELIAREVYSLRKKSSYDLELCKTLEHAFPFLYVDGCE